MIKINKSDLNTSTINPDETGYFNKVGKLYGEKTGNLATTVYCDIGSSNLLVVAGESWTFGDNLFPHVKAADDVDNIPYRLTNNFAGRLANFLNHDLLLVARPGNRNTGIYNELREGLQEAINLKQYSNINAICQFTSPGRDISTYNLDKVDIFSEITKNRHSFKDWHNKYENILIEEFTKLLDQYNVSKRIFWKNFYPFVGNIENYKTPNTVFIEKTMSEYFLELAGISPVVHAEIMELQIEYSNIPYLDMDIEYLAQNANNYEKYINSLHISPLNNYHPTVGGHWLWTNELRRYLFKNKKELI